MAKGKALVLLAICMLVSAVAGSLYSGSDVLQISGTKEFAAISAGAGVAAVEFYAPWCGHCQALAPHWKKTSTSLKGIATVAAVDCDVEANKNLCSQFGVKSFPTIKLFGSDQQKNSKTGEWTKEALDYEGPRTAKMITERVLALLTDVHVRILEEEGALAEFLSARPDAPKALLLTEKKEVGSLWKSLSTRFAKGMGFAQVHVPSAGSGLLKALGVTEEMELPVVVLLKKGAEPEQYVGILKAPQLLAWFSRHATGVEGSAGADGDSAGGSKAGSQAPVKKPVEILYANMEELAALDDKEAMALVGLLAGDVEKCASKIEELRGAVKDLQGMLPLLQVHATPEDLPALERYGVSASDMEAESKAEGCSLRLLLLPFGSDKADLDEYQVYPPGPLDGKALAAWVGAGVPDFSMPLSPENFQRFIALDPSGHTLQQAAEDGEHGTDYEEVEVGFRPKVVLFTNKDEVPALFRALALAFRGRSQGLAFGWVRAHDPDNEQLVESLKPPKVPCMIMVMPMPDSQGEGKIGLSAQPYNGALKFGPMRAWLEEMLKVADYMAGGKTSAPPVDVPAIKSQDDLATFCTGKGAGICIIALTDASQKNSHASAAKVFGNVAAEHVDQPLFFSLLDAGKFRAFSNALGVMGSDLPVAVALSAKHKRYAVMPGQFGQAALKSFIDGVLGGKVRTQPLSVLPVVETSGGEAPRAPAQEDFAAGSGSGDAGAGEGAAEEEAPVEEEFSLDDIMSEEVEGGEALSKEERLRQVDEEIKAEEAAKAAAQKKTAGTKKGKSKKGKKAKKATKSEL